MGSKAAMWFAASMLMTIWTPLATSESSEPIRLIVGFRTLPQDVEGGAKWFDADVVRVDRGLQFAVVLTQDPVRFAARVSAEPGFAYIEEDSFETWIQVQPNDPRFNDQYGPQDIEAPAAWGEWRGSTAKTVCIVDTGVRGDHEDFVGGRYVGGYDFVNSDSDPNDDQGHGTHVAGSAAAGIDNARGIAGIANVRIRAMKVLNSNGQGYHSDIASGIRECADRSVGVISLSLGGSGSSTMENAVNYAWDAGSLLVAATGNDGCSPCVLYPAAYPKVIAVACTTSTRGLCYFSSGGPQVDLAAPGYDILSTTYSSTTSYGYKSGTSMSTPHVSGVAALVWSYAPDMTNTQIRDALETTATDLGAAGRDDSFGQGLVNARLALAEASVPIELPIVIEESFDDGVANGFTLNGFWHVSDLCDNAPPSAPKYLGYHRTTVCNYETTLSSNSGEATRAYDLTTAVQAKLSLTHRFEHESANAEVDQKRVMVSTDNGATWDTLWLWDARTASQPWNTVNFSLNPYVGGVVQVRFAFDTVDALSNNYDGWLIDDVRVAYADNYPPRARAGNDAVAYDGDGDGFANFTLDGRPSSDADGTLVASRWIDNGQTLATTLLANVSLAIGVHAITLNVTDNDGASAEDVVVADARPNRPPAANISVSCSGLACTFNGTRSSDPDGPLAAYAWDFGDGETATGAVASHTFANNDTRVVRLNVTDAGGLTSGAARTLSLGTVIHFQHDFDSALPPTVTMNGLWHVASDCITSRSAPSHLAYRRTTVCDFATGSANAGQVRIPIDLSAVVDARLTFHQIAIAGACSPSSSWDRRMVDVLSAQGAFIARPFLQDCRSPQTTSWTPVRVNLTPYVGQAIIVQLAFDSSTSTNNDKLGWAIDDLSVASGPEPPIAVAGPDLLARDGDGNGAETVTLDGRASTSWGGIASYTWTQNDVEIGTTGVVNASFGIGVHTVKLTVIDTAGLMDEDTVEVDVRANTPPVASLPDDISARDVDASGSEVVALDGRASSDIDGTIATYTWLIDGVEVATGAQANATAALGSHALTLRVADNGGGRHEKTSVLTILPNRDPIARAPAAVTVRDTDGTGAQSVTLADAGSSDPDATALTYAWYENDTALSTSRNFTMAYPIGERTIRLRVTDVGGAWDEDTVLVTVLENRAPVARAGNDQSTRDLDGTGSEPIMLVDAGSSDPDLTTLSYAWYEGAALLGTTASVSTSLGVGNHTVILRVSDIGGAVGEDTLNVEVLPNRAPYANASIDVTRIDANGDGVETAALLDSGSFDPDATALTFTWLENGATIGNGTNLTKDFTVGLHVVTLRATDIGGAYGEDIVLVDVKANTPPTARASVTCLDVHCAFNASASSDAEGPVTISWVFGDGTTANGTTVPDHAYPRAGNFTWSAIARDIGGATHTVQGTVFVAPEAPRPARTSAPSRPQVLDKNLDEAADRLPAFDVDAAWFEGDYNHVYVGLQARPGAAPVGVAYAVSFTPSWTPADPTWNGTISGSAQMTTLHAQATFDPEPTFTLVGMSGSTQAFTQSVNGSWDAENGVVWWQLPVGALQKPRFGAATLGSPRAASYAIAPLTLNGAATGDTTGTAPGWTFAYTTRGAAERIETFDFEETSDGFAKENEQIQSEVNWDPASGAIVLMENKADLRAESFTRDVGDPLTPAASFEVTARFHVRSHGDAQPSTPLFLGATNVAFPQSQANVVRIAYTDVVAGLGTYTLQYRDAAGLLRLSASLQGPEDARFSMAYDATTRRLNLTVMDLAGATVGNASYVLPAGQTFRFDKVGVASDGAPGVQQAAPMIAHVDDIVMRYRA